MEVRINLQSLDQGATPYAATIASTALRSLSATCGVRVRARSERSSHLSQAWRREAGLKFQYVAVAGGLPLDAVPRQGWIEMRARAMWGLVLQR